MSGRILAILTVLFLGLATPVVPQEERGLFRLGVGLSNGALGGFDLGLMPTVYVPITANDALLIERGVGLLRVFEGEGSTTMMALGTGLLFVLVASPEDRLYIGPRIGIVRFSESFSAPGFDFDDSFTNLTAAGVVGGEAALRWLDLSEGSNDDATLISTMGEFRVRW